MTTNDRAMLWPAAALAVAAAVGAALGVTALPRATPELALAAVGQLAVAALGLLAPRWPVLWTAAVAVVSLSSTLATADLSALAFYGAAPWVNLATALAAQNLFRRASDRRSVVTGSILLGIGSLGLVVVVAREGVPPATAVVAATVPYLAGALVAVGYQLRDARADRLSAARASRTAVPAPDDAATRALAMVALRADELARSAPDRDTRLAAADLSAVASRAMTDQHAAPDSTIWLQVVAPGPASTVEDAAGTRSGTAGGSEPALAHGPTPADDLPEREREILRLVATGASNAEVARDLYLSEATVKQYVSRLMKRFDRRNRTQLALLAAPWFDRP